MKLILENWRQYLNKSQNDSSLVEADFFDSPDVDQPGKNQIILFNPEEQYSVEGATHGGLSHMIKHYMEFEPSRVAAGLKQALQKAATFSNFILKNAKSGQTLSLGDEAKKAANENAMLNTFDHINDKIKNNKPLTDEEKQLSPIIEALNQEYQKLVDSYIAAGVDIEGIQDAAKIKQVLDAGKIVKFVGSYKGASFLYFLNAANTGLVASTQGKVATLFRIDKKGNDLSKVAKYFGRGVELKNPAFRQALASYAGVEPEQPRQQQKQQQQQKKRPNPKAIAMGMARGGKTPEEIQAQIKKSTGFDISVDNIKKMIGT